MLGVSVPESAVESAVESDSIPAVFIPTIGAHDPGAMSRVYDNTWESGDKVGVYMKPL